MTALLRHQVKNRYRTSFQGVTLRQRIRHRLHASDSRTALNPECDRTDLVSVLSSLSRSLRGGHSLRHAVIEAGNQESAGVIHFLAQRLSAGSALDQACAEFRARRTTRRRRPSTDDENSLVIGVMELAQAMGGDEARLIDSLVHSLIERRHVRHERQTQATTALSSMRLLTWLPIICGLWIVTESDSSRNFIFHTAAGRLCLIAGIVLNLMGRLWAERIVTSS